MRKLVERSDSGVATTTITSMLEPVAGGRLTVLFAGRLHTCTKREAGNVITIIEVGNGAY